MPTPEELTDLLSRTTFTRDELKSLHKTFKSFVGVESSPTIDKLDFTQNMGNLTSQKFTKSDYLEGLFQSLDRDGSGGVDFAEFILGIAIHTGKSKNAAKGDLARATFAVYDSDHDGCVGVGDVERVLRSSLDNNGIVLPHEIVAQLVRDTFTKYVLNEKGEITLEAFMAV